jgi:hypothetical protein
MALATAAPETPYDPLCTAAVNCWMRAARSVAMLFRALEAPDIRMLSCEPEESLPAAPRDGMPTEPTGLGSADFATDESR